jgi:O-methyltransferase
MKAVNNVTSLLSRHPIISDQITRPALNVVLRELETILKRDVPGDVVEFGCYIGTTSLFLRRLLSVHDPNQSRQLYAYDSFSGLPDKTTEDASGAGEQFQVGELTVSKKQFLHEFQKANLQSPNTFKGWFKDIAPDQLPDQIAFAFLDGDFYESIRDSLLLVWPRLVAGGTITIDDYSRAALPGVERAVQEFVKVHKLTVRHEHQIAIITR